MIQVFELWDIKQAYIHASPPAGEQSQKRMC